MKTPEQLKLEAMARAARPLNPSQPSPEDMARAMAARLVIEAASSIFVRQASQFALEGVSDESLAEMAREAFRAARVFLDVANSPVPEAKPAEKPATDANGSPVELEG